MLHDVKVKYLSWGALNAAQDNLVLVCHALTGNQQVRSSVQHRPHSLPVTAPCLWPHPPCDRTLPVTAPSL